MSTYNCSVWVNSGFNAINIPDSPALLNSISHLDFPVLELNQERFLPEVRIRATWEQIKNADYCKIGDFFYSVDNVFMSSGDVAVLSLTPDFVTSAGGPAALTFLDGVTSRVHVSDDTYGLYGEDDPYMAPAYDMEVMVDVTTGDFSGSSYTFVETTLDLVTLGTYLDSSTSNPPAITAVSDSQAEVTYPVVSYIPGDIKTDYEANIGGTAYTLPDTHGQVLYWRGPSESQLLTDGINVARSLGIEESISAQFNIPSAFIQAPTLSTPIIGKLTGSYGLHTVSGVPFEYGIAYNKRVFYGSQTKYVLASCSGSTMSVNAEDIYDGAANPVVASFADPRREGKPYFRFNPLNKVDISSSGKHKDAFRNSVAGMPWRSVPMVFTSKSGSILDRTQFDAATLRQDTMFQQASQNRIVNNVFGFAGSLGNMIGALGNEDPAGGVFGSAIQGGLSEAQRNMTYKDYKQNYLLQKAAEKQQFEISQNVNVPTINFAADPQLCADTMGNGFFVSRVVYSARDISRIDKILTAYGYKHTKQIEASDFTNRQYFNYVEAAVSVGNLPSWWATGIAAQISNGVRVWHVTRPSSAYYTTGNPVVVAPTPTP